MLRVFILLMFFFGSLFSQETDTLLRNILQLHSDTEAVNRLYSRGFNLRNKDPQQSYLYARYCEIKAFKTDSKKHLAKSYNLLGILYYKKGDFLKSLDYHTKALRLRKACNDLTGIATSCLNLGNVYSDLRLFAKSEKAYLNALSAYSSLNNMSKVSSCLLNLGILKHTLKQYDAAIENYNMALRFCEENDYVTKAMYLNNIGEAYLGKKDTAKALAFNEDALKLRLMSENVMESGDSYINLAGIYIVRGNLEKANEYILKADSIAIAYDYYELKTLVLRTSAYYNYAIKNFKQGFDMLNRYYIKHDSAVAQQQLEVLKYNFDEYVFSEEINYNKAPVSNFNLLYVLIFFSVTIPYFLIKQKR